MPFYSHHPRLPSEHYRGRVSYFVTICCAMRRPVFRDVSLGQKTLGVLRELVAKHSFSLSCYCLMPDHLHFLTSGQQETSDLLKFVNQFKQVTAFNYRRTNSEPLWQGRFYDHILRKSEAVEKVACYIWMNPVRKGLCDDPHAYPLSGSQTIAWMSHSIQNSDWTPPWKALPV